MPVSGSPSDEVVRYLGLRDHTHSGVLTRLLEPLQELLNLEEDPVTAFSILTYALTLSITTLLPLARELRYCAVLREVQALLHLVTTGETVLADPRYTVVPVRAQVLRLRKVRVGGTALVILLPYPLYIDLCRRLGTPLNPLAVVRPETEGSDPEVRGFLNGEEVRYRALQDTVYARVTKDTVPSTPTYV